MSTEQQRPVTPPSAGDSADTVETTATWGAANTSDAAGVEWGARQPKPKRSVKKLAVAVAVALGIAGAGAGVVYAASDSTSSTEQGPGGQGGMGGGPGGMGGGAGGLMSEALHGEYVVSDGNGNYTTEILQNGEVTAVSDTSITAKSEDGYTKTYTIDSDTTSDLSSIATGDDVTITAIVSGDTATVETVVEEGTATGQGQMGTPPDQSGTTQDSDGTTSGN
jgi:hypothetical protein